VEGAKRVLHFPVVDDIEAHGSLFLARNRGAFAQAELPLDRVDRSDFQVQHVGDNRRVDALCLAYGVLMPAHQRAFLRLPELRCVYRHPWLPGAKQ
jgi:hypothetical protein